MPAVVVEEARRSKAKNQAQGTLRQEDAVGERESLAPPVNIAATQELPAAETDTEGWQVVAGKKRHGGRDERPAQGLAPTAQHRHEPKKQPPRWSWTAARSAEVSLFASGRRRLHQGCGNPNGQRFTGIFSGIKLGGVEEKENQMRRA